jgi:hypothetical protein
LQHEEIGSWQMSSRAAEVDAAYRWGVPLHVWDSDAITDEQRAEMVAWVRARAAMEAWEAHMQVERARAKSGERVNIE